MGGRGESVIDYVLVNEEIREEVEKLEVEDSIESDHPIVIWLKEEKRVRGEEKEGRREYLEENGMRKEEKLLEKKGKDRSS